MKVPMLDLRAQYAAIKPEIDAAVEQVLMSQQFRGGPMLERFEVGLAEFAQVRHALGVSSGTDALYLALKALPLHPGDEVITSPFTFFATASAIVHAGCIPVFADIEPRHPDYGCIGGGGAHYSPYARHSSGPSVWTVCSHGCFCRYGEAARIDAD